MVNGIYIWQSVVGVFTPGGDPCWRCPSCGGDEHVYGIESPETMHHECKECKTKLIYPWEKCDYCEHFDYQQDAKMFGHPCDLHGAADPYGCKDYKYRKENL